MKRTYAIGLASLTCWSVAACSRSDADLADPRLTSLEQRIQAEQVRLLAVQQAVADAEAKAEAARVEAQFQSCRAEVKEVRAEVERRRAGCAKQVGDQNLCVARNSKRQAEGGLLGCTVGIAAAVLSDGAAAPWALGGCGVGLGAGALSADACPDPSCSMDLDQLELQVVAEKGIVAVPRCGGFAGLVLGPRDQVAPAGITIARVLPGELADAAGVAKDDILIQAAATAGLRPGDIVTRLASAVGSEHRDKAQNIRSTTDAETFLEDARPGEEIAASVARGNSTAVARLHLAVRAGQVEL